MTTTAAPTAKEAATALQDAHDERDRLQRRFDAGDPPTQKEWTTSLQNVEYATLSLRGLTAKEESESEASARKRAWALRRKYRKEVGKGWETVLAEHEACARAITALILAVSSVNDTATAIAGEASSLLPAHISLDAPTPSWLRDALKFGGVNPPLINASPLIQSAAFASLGCFQKTLRSVDIEFLRSLDGPPQAEIKALHSLKEQLRLAE